MQLKIPILTLLTSFLITFATLSVAQDTTYLKIIVTTDVHGHILPYDPLERASRPNSLAQVYSFVMNERVKAKHEVILLDNGDILQGDPFVYYYNFIDTTGIHPVARVMNYMGYDAATIGNHDIEAGPVVYDKLIEQFNFPWLGANIIEEATGMPYFRPYTIIERNNIRIAVLGLITPSVPLWLPEELWKGLYFDDMLESARKWTNYIKKYEKPDLLIGLFHSGAPVAKYPDGIPAFLEQASRVIAQEVGGFDMVFTGHDHRRWNEFVSNADDSFTLLLGAGSLAHSVGVADIKLIIDPLTKSTRKEIAGNVLELARLPANAGLLDKFFDYIYPVQDYLNQPVTTLNQPLYSREALFQSAPFVNLIHHIQLSITGADISFSAPLSFDAVIPSGMIDRGALFNLYRYENQLYTMTLSGQEIVDFLEFSYGNWLNQMQNADDHLLNFVKNERAEILRNAYGRPQTATPYFNYESAAGLIYSVDVRMPPGNRVAIESFVDGRDFSLDSTYKVAINSYRASGGGEHLTSGAGIPHRELKHRITWASGTDLRYLIMHWLRKNGVPESTPSVNWIIIPEEWHAKGKLKDFNILFDQ
jgi:2',3'-cyclic-nucleotide 2'-phosphodiesterase / 3'-nucleotidase